MRVKIIRILLFWVFLPLVILRHIFRKDNEVVLGHEAIEKRLSQKKPGNGKHANKLDPKELEDMLHTDISTENIL